MEHHQSLNNIREAEELLFAKWRNQLANQNKIFIPDGVVNLNKWEQAKIRVLFLLKEVNGGQKEWDERDYLAKYNTKQTYIDTHSPTITALIQWIHAVQSDTFTNWDSVLSQTQNLQNQSQLLEQIALVNVKKVPGGGTVDAEKFDSYWQKDENVQNLKEQLTIYTHSPHHPDFIICGSTAWYYQKLFKEEGLRWETTTRGIPYCKHGQTIILDYCHPQARIAACIKYYGLFDAIQEIKSL